MKRLLFAVLIAIASGGVYAQHCYAPVDTVKLNKAYRALMKADTKANQEAFFNAFPKNWMEYVATYQYIETSRYIWAKENSQYSYIHEQVYKTFRRLNAIPKEAYCRRLIDLCVGGRDSPDGPSALLSLLREKMKEMPDVFFSLLSELKPGYQCYFWSFYWWAMYPDKKESDALLKSYQEKYKGRYPEVVENMTGAYRYFCGNVTFADWSYFDLEIWETK